MSIPSQCLLYNHVIRRVILTPFLSHDITRFSRTSNSEDLAVPIVPLISYPLNFLTTTTPLYPLLLILVANLAPSHRLSFPPSEPPFFPLYLTVPIIVLTQAFPLTPPSASMTRLSPSYLFISFNEPTPHGDSPLLLTPSLVTTLPPHLLNGLYSVSARTC